MAYKKKHWCPNKCGKTITYTLHWKQPKPYYCNKCETWYNKEELTK